MVGGTWYLVRFLGNCAEFSCRRGLHFTLVCHLSRTERLKLIVAAFKIAASVLDDSAETSVPASVF